mgnify:CR=1 FL=1
MKKLTQENHMFQQMRKAALERLHGCDPVKIASRTGIFFDRSDSLFHLTSLGNEIRIHFPDFRTEGTEDEWHELVLLHYMDMADGTPLTGQLIPFGELPQGMIRGGGFDRDSERSREKSSGKFPPGTQRKSAGSWEPKSFHRRLISPPAFSSPPTTPSP